MEKLFIYGLLFIESSYVYGFPIITNTSSNATKIEFSTKLNEKLPTGYKVKINYGIDKGLVAMSCSGLTCTLSTNKFPSDVNSTFYKVGIYDSLDTLYGEGIDGYYTIISSAKIVDSNYSKISNSGTIVPDTSKLGVGKNDWACTKDNKTGLIWEVKTTDGGNHDMNKSYTNILLTEKNDIIKYNDSTNTEGLVKLANSESLCGATNWRLPKLDELMTLIVCSDGEYNSLNDYTHSYYICANNLLVTRPVINTMYFPNTKSNFFWAYGLDNSSLVWKVDFGYSSAHSFAKYDDQAFIRLVHK